jgi:DNA-binding IclR family transcriptional regulator
MTTMVPAIASDWARDIADRVSETELAVLDVLEQLGALDETQVASSARLPPSVTTEALARLADLGFVDRSDEDPAFYSLRLPTSGRLERS